MTKKLPVLDFSSQDRLRKGPKRKPRLGIKQVADRLGQLKTEMKKLSDEENELKEKLRSSGREVIEGSEYRVVVSTYETSIVDYQAVLEHIKSTPALRKLISRYTSSNTVVSVYVRPKD